MFWPAEGSEKDRGAHLLDVILWSLMAAVTLFGIAAAILDAELAWTSVRLVAFVDLACGGLTLLNRIGWTQQAAALLVALAWALVTMHAVLTGGLRASTPSAYLVIILVGSLFFSYRAGVLTAILFSLTALGIVGAEVLHLLPHAHASKPGLGLWLTAATTVGGIFAVQLIAIRAVWVAQRRSREREALLSGVLGNLPVGVWLIDAAGQVVHKNQAARRIWADVRDTRPGGAEEYRGRRLATGEVIQPHEWASARVIATGEACPEEEIEIECFDGTQKIILNSAVPILGEGGEIKGAIAVNQDVTGLKSAQESLKRSELQMRGILDSVSDGFFTLDREWRCMYMNAAAAKFIGARGEDLIGKQIWDWLPEAERPPLRESYARAMDTGEVTTFEEFYSPLAAWAGGTIYPSEHGVTVVFQDITVRKRAEEKVRQQLTMLTTLHSAASALAGTLESTRLAEDVTRVCVEVLGVELAWVGIARPDGTVQPLAQFSAALGTRITASVRWGSAEDDAPTARAIRTGAPVVVCDVGTDPTIATWRSWAQGEGFACAASFPLISRGKPFGSLTLYGRDPAYATPERIEMFQTYAHEVAAAMANARLFEETERRLRRVQALRQIDRSIASSHDQRVTLDILLEQVRAELRVDATDILLLGPETLTLTAAAAHGFLSRETRATALRLGEDDAGIAALELRTLVGISPARGTHPRWTSLAAAEGFVWRAATPLVIKGEVKGVLEVFHRTPFDPDEDWLSFFETLGAQAAIAVDTATLADELRRSNLELKLAYEATIEGWSRAMDLRDRETEGHTQRVTALSLRLAREFGLREDEIGHLRRGALLHDIGKMGVPDSILLKEGPLTEDEWEVMRQHTTFALELLTPIRYLRRAIDIPYAHHEKWDGTGYPRGRRAEQIPLAARIFAVVDVWDALRSDRPYRAAWPVDRVREHIRSLSGTHLDPMVVDAFLALDLSEVDGLTFPQPHAVSAPGAPA